MAEPGIEIRKLTADDAQSLSQLRLEALELEPQAFTESVEEHHKLPIDELATRLSGTVASGNFVLGAFVQNRLAGVAGFTQRQGPKIRRRGLIWGVYIQREFRHQGMGRLLLTEVLRLARTLSGLEQIHLAVGTCFAFRTAFSPSMPRLLTLGEGLPEAQPRRAGRFR